MLQRLPEALAIPSHSTAERSFDEVVPAAFFVCPRRTQLPAKVRLFPMNGH
jgi:hypothetical protein